MLCERLTGIMGICVAFVPELQQQQPQAARAANETATRPRESAPAQPKRDKDVPGKLH
jgi:hypothetical protein